jgi:hypothetical protein
MAAAPSSYDVTEAAPAAAALTAEAAAPAQPAAAAEDLSFISTWPIAPTAFYFLLNFLC